MDNTAQTLSPCAAPAADLPLAAGPMQAEPIWLVEPSGQRRFAGRRLRDMISLEVMVVQARQRHDARHAAKPIEDRPAFVPPFTPSQISVARAYRDLVEWREGSPMRGSDLTGGQSGGGGAGLFIDSYIANGAWIETLRERIGDVVVMDIRRHMDRGNTRRPITARALVDQVVLEGKTLTQVLQGFGWVANTANLKATRVGLCAALDRMTGPVRSTAQTWQDAAVLAQSAAQRKGA